MYKVMYKEGALKWETYEKPYSQQQINLFIITKIIWDISVLVQYTDVMNFDNNGNCVKWW